MNDTVEVSVMDLKGPALDYAVAIAEGMRIHTPKGMQFKYWYKGDRCVCSVAGYSPSESWHDGGPLIDAHKLGFTWSEDGSTVWCHDLVDSDGPSHLIAACRAIVASKFGLSIMIPKELAA